MSYFLCKYTPVLVINGIFLMFTKVCP